jgi:hypothetical protein
MASYNYTFVSGDTVTPTKLNDARTVSDIVNADISATAAIAGSKVAPAFGAQDITVSTANRSITNTGNFALSFGTNNTERVRITGDGDFRISRGNFSSVALIATGTGGREYRVTSTDDANGLGGGKFSIYDQTANAARLLIDASGNVGIGATAPSYLLDVRGGSAGVFNSAGDAHVYVGEGTGANEYGFLRWDRTNNIFDMGTDTATPARLLTNNTERMRITAGGEVWIAGNTDQGAFNLQCNGTGVWGAGAYVNGSDERLKDNIAEITEGLDVVKKLRPVSFNYKPTHSKDTSKQAGFIAQELLVALEGKDYAEGTVKQGPEFYNVAYQNLIPVMAKAIQELSAKVEALEAAR